MARDIELRLNPDLDPAPFAEAYARDKLVRIPEIFAEETAAAIEEVLMRTLSWRLVFPEPSFEPGGREQVAMLTQDDIARLGREGMARRMQGVLTRASQNYGYLYHAYPMIQAYTSGWDSGHPVHQITEFLNSPEFLEFGREVIGASVITKADAQATLYARGNFLTRHTDEGHDRERRAAYTLGFTRSWEPDWGGMLAFFDDELNVSRAFLPRFNMLSLFDGTVMHSVGTVTQFAAAGRYQITGWLRDDPPASASAGG
ncbi:proline hydroxylase [Marinicauda pacifica]|uniref:Proline hydroxylase n=1 Tax=Marinicauda pacifica TaxID=1133559 RepID=A0A4S2H854_9PROT|nr:2OG-Fe(II) oxygenase family protein [Marinicauda pacifica]TGY91701.1 proline hydroxylase [Marinicauda pacifica]GGE51314.1 proline hydroxylase [Marinicauda pacifica]